MFCIRLIVSAVASSVKTERMGLSRASTRGRCFQQRVAFERSTVSRHREVQAQITDLLFRFSDSDTRSTRINISRGTRSRGPRATAALCCFEAPTPHNFSVSAAESPNLAWMCLGCRATLSGCLRLQSERTSWSRCISAPRRLTTLHLQLGMPDSAPAGRHTCLIH
jgi:hypothetical protein